MKRRSFLKKLPFLTITGFGVVPLIKYKKLTAPDRFLCRTNDPAVGYITAERMNDTFKALERRVEKLED